MVSKRAETVGRRSGADIIDATLAEAAASGINTIRMWAHTTTSLYPFQARARARARAHLRGLYLSVFIGLRGGVCSAAARALTHAPPHPAPQTEPGVYDERGLKALDFVLETARKYGLQVRAAPLPPTSNRPRPERARGGGARSASRRARGRGAPTPRRALPRRCRRQVIVSLIDNWKYYNGVDQYVDWSTTAPVRGRTSSRRSRTRSGRPRTRRLWDRAGGRGDSEALRGGGPPAAAAPRLGRAPPARRPGLGTLTARRARRPRRTAGARAPASGGAPTPAAPPPPAPPGRAPRPVLQGPGLQGDVQEQRQVPDQPRERDQRALLQGRPHDHRVEPHQRAALRVVAGREQRLPHATAVVDRGDGEYVRGGPQSPDHHRLGGLLRREHARAAGERPGGAARGAALGWRPPGRGGGVAAAWRGGARRRATAAHWLPPSPPPAAQAANPGAWGVEMGQDFVSNTNIKEIDFATVHAWPDNWMIPQARRARSPPRRARRRRRLRRAARGRRGPASPLVTPPPPAAAAARAGEDGEFPRQVGAVTHQRVPEEPQDAQARAV